MNVSVPPSAPSLRPLVRRLADDLLTRATEDAEIDTGLRQAFRQIEKGGRTAQAYEVWREDYLEQVAVAWVLACVFVRFLEDNHLIDECWLAGEGERRKLAEDAHELYFREHPHDTDREYFHHVFRKVGKIPAAKDLFAEGKTPLWAVGPSGDAAMKLLSSWREIDAETGRLVRTFAVEDGDTRFLGDLYQDLSERARKKYALLQTPVFVEEFILDRTLDPAIDAFGLDAVLMIDPTCGSGHFLLGGFDRLFRLWMRREDNEIKAAQMALDGVWGVDVNPFAVAIARFRLIVAAARACGIRRLKDAPGWTIHLATGDSLLFGSRWNRGGEKVQEQTWFATDEGTWAPDIYACEDKVALEEVLNQQYHAVVGNPPYITVKDSSLSAAHRKRYPTCHRQYSLAVPFAERFFDLAMPGVGRSGSGVGQAFQPDADRSGSVRAGRSQAGKPDLRGSDRAGTPDLHRAGFVGMITANSFMKREFGKKLIEEFFTKVDLTHVIDTSGAYIPGHGTPTVILLGRNRPPVGADVRAVLGIRGEPTTPDNPAEGLVWRSIIDHLDDGRAQNEFVSVTDVDRATFGKHPWSIGGGGAAELQSLIESQSSARLDGLTVSVGRVAHTGNDEAYVADPAALLRRAVASEFVSDFVEGESLRDWALKEPNSVLFPYSTELKPIEEDLNHPVFRWLWPFRDQLWERREPNGTHRQIGKTWYEFSRFHPERYLGPGIAIAFVATHNHFVLDRGGKVFKQSAPIIKLPAGATEDDHLALVGLLNSSTACFWMKQVFHSKGSQGVNEGLKTEFWEQFFEFTGTGVGQFPVLGSRTETLPLARELDSLARRIVELSPAEVVKRGLPTAEGLSANRAETERLRMRMVALQEELDWLCYRLYGLIEGDGSLDGSGSSVGGGSVPRPGPSDPTQPGLRKSGFSLTPPDPIRPGPIRVRLKPDLREGPSRSDGGGSPSPDRIHRRAWRWASAPSRSSWPARWRRARSRPRGSRGTARRRSPRSPRSGPVGIATSSPVGSR